MSTTKFGKNSLFEFMKSNRIYKKLDTSYENVFDDLLEKMAELADVRTVSGTPTDVMAKTLAAVRDIEAFRQVVLNPPFGLQALNSTLRSRALETDGDIIRSNYQAGGSNIRDGDSFLVDRNLRTRGENNPGTRTKGFGKPSYRQGRLENKKDKIPWNMCIVCNKLVCHSSKHCRTFGRFAAAFLTEDGDGNEKGDLDEDVNE